MNTYNGHKPRPFVSKEDMLAHTLDKRYRGGLNEADPAYQDFVKECLMMSEDATVGANVNLQAAMSQPVQQWQDPNQELSKLTDTYRDMTEAKKDQTSALYKESPFERQRVAEKIDRSVPDSALPSGKNFASYQATIEGEG